MAKWILAAGAAALALTTPALAGPDGGHGGGGGGGPHGGGGGPHGGGGGPQQHGNPGGGGGGHGSGGHGGGFGGFGGGGFAGFGGGPHGGGGPNGGGGHQMRAERGHGGGRGGGHQMMRMAHGNGGQHHQQMARAEHGHGGNAMRHDARIEHGNRVAMERHNADRQLRDQQRAAAAVNRDIGNNNRVDTATFANNRAFGGDRRIADNLLGSNFAGFGDSCPPGLARKDNGCLPPGQAKKLLGAALPLGLRSAALEGPYSQWYRDNDQYYYRNDGDYIYQVSRNGDLVNGLFPYQDQDYSYYPVGMNYPLDYNSYNVPYQYQSYFPDGNGYNYRYGDGAIYQVNPANNTINSIVALLAGDLGVGQQLPSDYGVYNVPMAYRDRYYDTPDALYRYNDGYIYQADPKTQLITAVIDALV